MTESPVFSFSLRIQFGTFSARFLGDTYSFLQAVLLGLRIPPQAVAISLIQKGSLWAQLTVLLVNPLEGLFW